MNQKAQKLLNEARALLASAEESQVAVDEAKWAAAERMWKANREEGVNQEEIGRAVGLTQTLVSRYVRVWELGTKYARPKRPSFTEAWYELLPEAAPDARREGYAKKALREADEETVEEIVAALPPDRQAIVARAAVRHAANEVMADPALRHIVDEARPSEDRGEQARRLVRDPAVARQVVQDDRARSNMARAAKEMEEEAGQRQRDRAPGLVGMSDYYQATGELSRARQALTKSLDAMRRVDLGDDERESLKEDVGRVRLVLDWIDSYLDSGDHSFDKELDALLREET
jgi:hypothetical protein